MKLLSTERSATSSILIIIGIFLINYLFIGGIIQILIMLGSGISMSDLLSSGGNISKFPNAWYALILAQGIGSFLAFIGTAWFYWKIIEKKSWDLMCSKPIPKITIFLLVILIQIAFMGLSGWLQEVNQAMKLPASLKGLEDFMKNMESQLEEATKMLTNFDSFGKFILAFVVIAVIAGIGEELIFRGLIMRKLFLGSNNIHVAVWISAFIFSAIHFQFYGFLPRMMLGVLFGYLYYWSGNLWVPIFAHIFNNGLIVVLMYLKNLKIINVDLESIDKVPLPAVIASLVFGLGFMYLFKNYSEKSSFVSNS